MDEIQSLLSVKGIKALQASTLYGSGLVDIVKGERDMKDMDGADEIDVLRYEAFRAYSNMFLKKQYKAIGIKFDLDEDEDVLDILNQHPEKKKFVCDLIREDMKKHGR